jgi:hypothetical protein
MAIPMKGIVKVTGVQQILSKMKAHNSKHGQQFQAGLVLAGIHLERISRSVFCPVHKGNLKASGFSRRIGAGWQTDVIVGYTAAYAVYVHENMDAKHGREFNIAYMDEIATAHTRAQKKYYFNRGETQQAKYLERPAREERQAMLNIIGGMAKIKP